MFLPERKWIKERMHHTERPKPSADQAEKTMSRNSRSTRMTEDFPASNDFKREGDRLRAQRITREQGHMTKTPDIIRQQTDGYIEGQQISGDTAPAPARPLDINWRRLELLCFSGQVCRLFQGNPSFRRLEL
jgi:hypothetical protein